jgi:hypothetical protein
VTAYGSTRGVSAAPLPERRLGRWQTKEKGRQAAALLILKRVQDGTHLT